MFRNDFATYYKGIRAVSDELYRENRLSIVETDGHGKSYGEWKQKKQGAPTLRGMVKADVDTALTAADSFPGFIAELQKMGYEVKYGPQVAHITVRHKDAKKNVRLDRLDEHYSEATLRDYFEKLRELPPEWRREYKQRTAPEPPRWQPKAVYKPMQRRARYRGHLPEKCGKITGFMACYYHYCALLRKAYCGKVSRRSYYLLREDFIRFNRYRQQCDLIWEQKITTVNELLTYKEQLQTTYDDLTAQRKALYRAKNIPGCPERSEQIQALTTRIRALRRDIGICANIEADCESVADKAAKVRQAEQLRGTKHSEIGEVRPHYDLI